jgi:hypothetical protein
MKEQKIMAYTELDDYVRARVQREPEFGRLMRESAIELLDGTEEDRRIAFRIFRDQLGLTDDEIAELKRKRATA